MQLLSRHDSTTMHPGCSKQSLLLGAAARPAPLTSRICRRSACKHSIASTYVTNNFTSSTPTLCRHL